MFLLSILFPLSILLFIPLIAIVSSNIIPQSKEKIVFPIVNDTLIWSLQALKPILLLNGYSNESKFKQKQIFPPQLDFFTIGDVENIGLNRITIDTLVHSIKLLCWSFQFDLRIIKKIGTGNCLENDTPPHSTNNWTCWIEIEGRSKIAQIAFLNGTIYYQITFYGSSSTTLLPGKQVEIPDYIKKQFTDSSLHTTANKALCFALLLIEHYNKNLKEFIFPTSIPAGPESAVTSVSYNRAMFGYLVLFVQPTNAAHLFHSLKVRGENLRHGMKTIALFLTQYYYLTSTARDNYWFQPEEFHVIRVAKQIIEHLLPSNYPNTFGIRLTEQPETAKIQVKLAALIQALLATDSFSRVLWENQNDIANNQLVYEQFLVLIKFWKQKGTSLISPFPLQAILRGLKVDVDSWNHLSLVQLITRILVCLSGKVAQKFALRFETILYCRRCNSRHSHSSFPLQSNFYIPLVVRSSDKQIALSTLIQRIFEHGGRQTEQ